MTKYEVFHGAHEVATPNIALRTSEENNESQRQARQIHPSLRMHRVATVRREQNISVRSAAKKLNCSVSHARNLEDETRDLKISDLREWQRILGVPLTDLLVDPEATLSAPVMARANLIRIMKTAVALEEVIDEDSRASRFVKMLREQLTAIMPELDDVLPWPSVGPRKGPAEMGRAADRMVDDRDFANS